MPDISNDLSFALKAIDDNIGLRPIQCIKNNDEFLIICLSRNAFEIRLRLFMPVGKLDKESVWEEYSFEEKLLSVKNDKGLQTVSFDSYEVETVLKEYAQITPKFSPGNFIKDRTSFLLSCIEEKAYFLPHTLSDEESFLLPLCRQNIFSSEYPLENETLNTAYKLCGKDSEVFRELERMERKKLSPLQSRLPDLLESDKGLEFHQRICKLLTPKNKSKSPTLTAILKKLEENGFTENNGCRHKEHFVNKALVSHGLKTHVIIRKKLKCFIQAQLTDGNITVLAGITDRQAHNCALQCAAKGKGLRLFEAFVIPENELSSSIIDKISDPALLLQNESGLEKFSLTQTPKINLPAVYVTSAIAWGALSGIVWGSVSAACRYLWNFRLPGIYPLFFIITALYAMIRLFLYRISVKR